MKPRSTRWADRTLTMLRANRLEACEKTLAGLGGFGVFDAEATDLEAERLFDQSWYAQEENPRHLHTLSELQTMVLSQFPAEMCLLSEDELGLLLKTALAGGVMPIHDWNDVLPAECLVRRLWCRTIPEKGRWLRMPRQISISTVLMLASEELKNTREVVMDVLDAVDNTLYLAGMMPAEVVEKDLAFHLQGSLAADKPMLYRRLLKASFETRVNREGRLMLVHPGLAEPWSLKEKEKSFRTGMDAQSLEELYRSLMEVEDPLYDKMLGQIQFLNRPEAKAEETVEDLILLAKQDVSVEEMRQVLAEKIICLPTEEMVGTLSEMHERIPRWFTLNMDRVQ